MFGVAVPGVAVGLAAVPPQPGADGGREHRGRPDGGIGHIGTHLLAVPHCAGSCNARGLLGARIVGAGLVGARLRSGGLRGWRFARVRGRIAGRRGVRRLQAGAAAHPGVTLGAADDEKQRHVDALTAGH
jgi:hypothetical protein